MCFELWGMLVQGNALTTWSMVVAKHFDTDEKINAQNAFEQAIPLYLESLVGLKYIGDQVISSFANKRSQQWCRIVTLNVVINSFSIM
jgi:hypothetical protein